LSLGKFPGGGREGGKFGNFPIRAGKFRELSDETPLSLNSEISPIAMCARYAKFINELLDAKNWKKTDLAQKVRERFPDEPVTNDQVYDFLDGKNHPRAGIAKAIEAVLEINLPPSYYGWGDARKVSSQS
jgi:ribosome-binding protein aMBF1 (putative translation factor)